MNLIKFLKQYQADIILALAVIFISITAFNLGKISALKQQKIPITITQPETANQLRAINYNNSGNQNTQNIGPVVASKKSTGKVYHFLWCPGSSKIAEKNKIIFSTEAAAIAAGYTLAGNCNK